MAEKKMIISIFGKSNSGKSTLVESLFERVDGIFIISYDKTKRLLSDYDREKHTRIIKDIELDFFKAVSKRGLPIIIDGGISTEKEYLKYLKMLK